MQHPSYSYLVFIITYYSVSLGLLQVKRLNGYDCGHLLRVNSDLSMRSFLR